jgi:50S ribosomal protein L16 3-hydroxylase
LNFPDSISAQDFLQQFWERKPLNMRGGVAADLPSLSPDELAWLATLEDVESRLVFTERHDGKIVYRVEHGPFANEELQQLPDKDWTLLVQDVEKHLPDFRAYFGLTKFIPDWRIDDLMVSFAAPGGSVGPHQDNYDVFLCQGAGTRTWHLADRDSVRPAAESAGLSLLEEYRDESPTVAESGDVLYLPPSIPHWGIASNACMTYSIGMRAPTRDEILSQMPDAAEPHALTDDDIYFRDPDLTLGEAEPGKISHRSVERTRLLLGDAAHWSDAEIAIGLGTTVTELKPWITPPTLDAVEAKEILDSQDKETDFVVHGMARLAYYESPDSCQVFVNGFSRPISGAQTALIGDICTQRGMDSERLQHAVKNAENRELLQWCVRKSLFDY